MPETASIEKSAPFAVFSIRVETIEIYKNTLQLKLSKAFENISFGVDLLDLFELRNKWLWILWFSTYQKSGIENQKTSEIANNQASHEHSSFQPFITYWIWNDAVHFDSRKISQISHIFQCQSYQYRICVAHYVVYALRRAFKNSFWYIFSSSNAYVEQPLYLEILKKKCKRKCQQILKKTI